MKLETRNSKLSGFLLATALALATIASYLPVRHYPFANIDDEAYVVDNVNVKYGVDAGVVKWAFTHFYQANWHPVTWLSHALDCEWFHLVPGRHHLMNVALHAANVLVLYWVLWLATGRVGRSLMVAALFALHPINVESVAWISERKNVLSMLFCLLALGAYTWYARRPGIGRYAAVFVLFALGLMAKPQIITLPCILLLWDYWPLNRLWASSDAGGGPSHGGESFARLVLEKVPLAVLAAASAVVTFKGQQTGGAMRGPINSFPLGERIANAVVSYVRYMGKAVWPSHLALIYPHSENLTRPLYVTGALLMLLAITALVLAGRRHRYLPVGWFWFLGAMVPMLGVVQVGGQAMADRYAYLPLIGLFIMVCWGVPDWAAQRRIAPAWPAAAGVVVCAILAVLTSRQVSYWKSNVALWAHTVKVTSGNFQAEANLGRALLDSGHSDEAISHFRAAIAIFPRDPLAYLYLGFWEQQHNHLPEAIADYKKVLELSQQSIRDYAKLRDNALLNMGYAYRDLGDTQRAYECFEAVQQQRREYAP